METMRRVTFALLAFAVAGPASGQAGRSSVRSHVTIADADGRSSRVIYSSDRLFEAPNWSPDGSYLLLNSGGKLWKLTVSGGEPAMVDSGAVSKINNDHGISPDGKTLAISAGPIYVLPSAGGEPRRLTDKVPSYFHGWSPDGKTLAFCGKRGDNFDLYAISADGGEERRLTEHAGYDDGPDYSPDGRWIYFNSDRSGSWDLWRIPADGAGPGDAKAERITGDAMEDWFPHPSPDGKWLVFVSFPKGTVGHPANQEVTLRRMPMPGGDIKPSAPQELLHLFGGQGTLNVNSWSPDGLRFAYVRYERIGASGETFTLPEPWNHADIGAVEVAGSAKSEEGTFAIAGTLDIWGKADGFHFVHRPLDGDGAIVARVVSEENTNEHAKAGVMIRESLSADARHAAMVVTPVDGTQFLRRQEVGGLTTNTNPLIDRGKLPRWVKLSREGDTFRAYESADGSDWTLVGTEVVTVPRKAFVGLVASSHQKTVTNTARLDRVSIVAGKP